MNDVIPGLPGSQPGFAMPLMRGFPCPVDIPVMGASDGPKNGLGVGWAQVHGHGVKFFISVHAGDGMTLMATLDYARYRRLCELLASAGQQAMLVPGVEERGPDDALAALGVAHKAMTEAKKAFDDMVAADLAIVVCPDDEVHLNDESAALGAAIKTVAAALNIKDQSDG